jgi:peptide/nickel transport system substrate-binding protein
MFKFQKQTSWGFGVIAIISLILSACATPTPQVIVHTQIVTEAGEEVIKEVVVTATPEPAKPAEYVDSSPDTYTALVFGDIDTMDPNLAYDTASANLIQNVMEGLIYFNRTDPTTYVPVLAEEVPSLENGGISADGLTYTFNIHSGVKYHNGNDLTPSDFEYTFERGLLQSDPNGPQWLLLEPLLNYHSGDVTEEIAEGAYAGDREALLANAKPEELAAVCEKVKATVDADDAAGTLTFHLAVPWGPWLATLAQSWGYAIDKEWAIENGAWDGDCATWQNFYAPGAENDELSRIVNGTGPYKLENWTPGEGYTLVANENYWRTDPLWEGGASGLARIQVVNVKIVEEWGTRFAALQAGDAETVTVNPDARPQVEDFVGEICDYKTETCQPHPDHPDAPLRKWGGLPQPSRTDVFLNYNVVTDEQGNNPYIGSGQLDGNGVPPDFFSDIHVRQAFNLCFDYDTYIADALNGDGVRNNGPIILDMLGYNPAGEMFQFNLDECKAEIEKAWDGKVAEVGFRVQVAFNTGNTTRQTVGAILQSNFAAIDPKYQIEIVGLPWPTLLRSFRARQLPVAVSGWIEDIHDPHNWVQPFTVGTFAGRQNLPSDVKSQFGDLVNAGVASSDPKERELTYFALQELHHGEAIQITLAQATGVRYEQRWVQEWYYNPLEFGGNYYAYLLAP